MLDTPETRYATTEDGVRIAYQVVGDGPLDVVILTPWASPIDLMWDHPIVAGFLNRLASFCRLILFDKRGSGVSDVVSVTRIPTLEQWMDDVRAVMDEAGSRKAGIVGCMEGGRMAIMFAATYPQRASALVLINAFARYSVDDVDSEQAIRFFERHWGSGALLDIQAPTAASDQALRRWWARFERVGNSPTMATAVFRAQVETDLRPVLPAIRVPTLVIQRDNTYMGASHGRYLADHIAGAVYRELPGTDHIAYVGDADAILDEVEEFLTGARHAVDVDRVLATVLFTDIVASTQRAADLGDRRWRAVLDSHDRVVAERVHEYRGRVVRTTGDGVLSTFDGPARAIRCASAIQRSLRELGIEIRAGLHTGEIELREAGDIGGIAVHIASRVMGLATAGEILVSRTVADLVVGSGLSFVDRGQYELKGVPGSWTVYSATG